MLKRLIFFIIRKRLGLKRYELFQFAEQKSNAMYYFTKDALMKKWRRTTEKSGVSLNWLLDDDCKIKKFGVEVEE